MCRSASVACCFLTAIQSLRTAEIPPAGAPAGFDSAANNGCIVRPLVHHAAPLRMTQWADCYVSAEIPPAGAPVGFDSTPQAFALK